MNEITIKKISDEELDKSLSSLFESERKTTKLILLHLLEAEERKLHAKRGYDSLFWMLIKHYKLSESSANRRIKAMRLLKDVPTAQNSIVTGELNLSTLSMAQAQIRQEEKIIGQKILVERKLEIIESIKNKTQAEAEVELFKLLPQTATSPKNTEKRIAVDATRLGLNVPDRVLNKLKRLAEVWSHVDPNMGYVEIIERCADETLKRVDPMLKKSSTRRATAAVAQTAKSQNQGKDKNKRATYYPVEVKRNIWSKANSCCEFVDHKTKRRCGSKALLQVDHVVPIWAGGDNDPKNLQLLCAVHNRLKYKKETDPTFVCDQVVGYG